MTILGDPLPDTTESFLVTLSNPSTNAILSDAQAVGTILPAVPIPNLSFAGVSQAEGNGTAGNNMVFTASLSTPAPQQILVRYNTVDGTATDGSDYTAQTGTLTFAVGQSQALITIPILGDVIEEPSESFTVNLTAISGPLGTLQTPATGLILNDDGPATLSVSDVTVIGGVTGTVPAVFTVSLSVAQPTQVTVGYVTVDNTATANEDYLAQSGILTFAPGQQIQTITVPVLGSAVAQPDETFLIALSSASGGATIEDAQGVGTIVRQGLTIGNVSLLEGNSGNTDAVFTVNLSQTLDHAVTVAFNTANGTATVANNDYVAASGTLTFAIGETSKTITVPIVGDTTVESNETFFVNLSNATGSALFNSQGNGTILNDDGQRTLIELRLADAAGVPLAPGATLSVGDHFQLQGYVQDIQESPNGIAAAYLDALYDSNVVGVDGPITFGPLFTNIQSGNLSTPGLIDEVGAFGQLTPPDDPGAAQLLFSIPFTALDQGVADFEAEAADVADHQVLEYTSDLPVPPAAINFVGTSINVGVNVFTINNVSVTEGNAGATQMVFTVTRFLPSGNDATVVYSTLDGTATAGQDYTAASGTLTFTGAETSQTITILVNGDTTDEEDEKFFLALSNPVGAGASQSPGVGTIVDDDGPPTLSIGAAAGSEGGDLVFTVSLSATSGKTVKVAYTTADALSAPVCHRGDRL